MSYCENNLPAGVRSDCTFVPPSIAEIIITNTDVEFTREELLDGDRTKWIEVIQTNKSAYLPTDIWDYEVTSGDSVINTTGIAKQTYVRTPPPSANVYIMSNPCDFTAAISKFKSKSYRVFFILEDGSIMCWENGSGKLKGFKAEVTAMRDAGGIPRPDTIQNHYKIMLLFSDPNEFKTSTMFEPEWIYQDLIDLMSIGANIREISDYTVTSDNMTFNVEIPCHESLATLLPADIEILNSNIAGTGPVQVSTLTYNTGTKLYTMVVTDSAGSPLALVSGDKFDFRVKSTDNNYYSDLVSVEVIS